MQSNNKRNKTNDNTQDENNNNPPTEVEGFKIQWFYDTNDYASLIDIFAKDLLHAFKKTGKPSTTCQNV